MAQADVLDYIRKTPHNSNVNVVKGMLNSESGGGGGAEPLIVRSERFPCPNDDGLSYAILDTTWQTIKDASYANRLVLWKEEYDGEWGYANTTNLLYEVAFEDGYYTVKFLGENISVFETDSEDGYPSNSAGCQGND